jgi:ribonuclease HII
VVIPPQEVDRIGLHVANVQGMRRALARLGTPPAYVLTDGFPVAGLAQPGLAVWKGDRVVACIAAASVLAKVTRDRILAELDERYPQYGFADHKGYCTAVHNEAIDRHGPCPEHRFSYVNVARRALGDARVPVRTLVRLAAGENDDQPGADADVPDAEPVNDLLEQR